MNAFFISNYFNHHQKYLSDALYESCEGYTFISTSKMREERKQLGYGIEDVPPYVLPLFDLEQKQKVVDDIDECDLLVFGSAPEAYIASRQRKKKLVFRYSERIYRDKYAWYKWLPRLLTFYMRYGRHKNTYLLCSGAYTYGDYAKHFTFIKKAYKWGYFPETKKYNDLNLLFKEKKENSILWAGRFLHWKHPDAVVRLAKHLKENGYEFELNMIGTGEMESRLKGLICELDLEDCVHMLGSMKPEQVRLYMEQSQIYLFTSDRNEGWGAVLNESMNSGCAVVASHAIGSVPFLIEDGKNGVVYESGDENDLCRKVEHLLTYAEERIQMGKMAYETIITLWNAEVAAKRLIELSRHILAGEKHPDLFEDGPCSRARIVKDGWHSSRK